MDDDEDKPRKGLFRPAPKRADLPPARQTVGATSSSGRGRGRGGLRGGRSGGHGRVVVIDDSDDDYYDDSADDDSSSSADEGGVGAAAAKSSSAAASKPAASLVEAAAARAGVAAALQSAAGVPHPLASAPASVAAGAAASSKPPSAAAPAAPPPSSSNAAAGGSSGSQLDSRAAMFTPWRPCYAGHPAMMGARPHPTPLKETTALASVPLPPLPAGFRHAIPQALVHNLSNAQLETVILAALRHSRRLSDGSRAGMLVGDATGVGKGREAAGIILHTHMLPAPQPLPLVEAPVQLSPSSAAVAGKKAAALLPPPPPPAPRRHLWFSLNTDLASDAARDMYDLGACDAGSGCGSGRQVAASRPRRPTL